MPAAISALTSVTSRQRTSTYVMLVWNPSPRSWRLVRQFRLAGSPPAELQLSTHTNGQMHDLAATLADVPQLRKFKRLHCQTILKRSIEQKGKSNAVTNPKSTSDTPPFQPLIAVKSTAAMVPRCPRPNRRA
jgi:DNA-binding FadR family transcriptional regulator